MNNPTPTQTQPPITIQQKITQNGCGAGCGKGCLILIALFVGLLAVALHSCSSIFRAEREKATSAPAQHEPAQEKTPTPKTASPSIDETKSKPEPPTNEPARPAAQTTEDKFRLRAIIAALSYAKPKLKDPESYTFKSCERFKHADMEFYLVRFTGDGRNLRVGVKVADDGTTSIIDKSKMPEIMKSSTPANSPNQ